MKDFNKYFIVGTNSDALHDTMNGMVVSELIRCKDCKHHEDAGIGMVYCRNIVGGWVEEEGYCYLAERK